ncbi:MAG: DNA polymerase III subunit [Pirellulaceae bacterium]
MSWNGIEGHDRVVEQFRRALTQGRLASTFLFVGPPGVGKRSFALSLAQALLCETRDEAALDPCGVCPGCVQVKAQSHPDLELVARKKDKGVLTLDLFIGDKEHRGQEGLCHRIALRPSRGGRKIAIIDDADYFNAESANCLLKTLEEPPPRSVIILVGTSEQRQLPTIRSRSQPVRFRPLPLEVVERLLVEKNLIDDAGEAAALAELSQGSLEKALAAADPALREFRAALFEQLVDVEAQQFKLAADVVACTNEAGKEAPLRRERMKLIFGFAVDFYRALMRRLDGLQAAGDRVLRGGVEQAVKRYRHDAEAAAGCLERCLAALEEVDRNANQATLAECWADDLAGITRRGYALLD